MTFMLKLPGGYHAPLAAHAIDRWRELVCPLRPQRFAIELLERLALDVGELTLERPAWMAPEPPVADEQDDYTPASAYLLVGDYVLPLVYSDTFDGMVFVTTIARGCVTPSDRAGRTTEHRDRRRRRRHLRHKPGDRRTGVSAAARAARAPDVDQWT